MGQYHKFMNFDKKEVCEPPAFRKLMEWSYQGNEYLLAVEQLLKTRWKGDRVLCVGDYVSDYYNYDEFSSIFDEILKENKDYQEDSIYSFPYKEIFEHSKEGIPSRYIYNHNTKEYIDIKKQPIQWGGVDKEDKTVFGIKIHPLSLLLSCSNGLGGGDYYSVNQKYVGYWVKDFGHIELSDVPLKNDYKEINIIFDEVKLHKSNSQILEEYIYEYYYNKDIDELKNVKFDDSLFLNATEKSKIINNVKNAIKTFSQSRNSMDEIDRDIIE